MSYEFREYIQLEVPDIRESALEFIESETKEKNSKKGLITEIAALHVGLTANHNYYSETELTESLNSWTEPYARPIIMNHDPYSEPVGRVMGAKMAKEDNGTPYVALQAGIFGMDAITKVLDKRYLTGSVGGVAKEAVCNVCGSDWLGSRESGTGGQCKHVRGKVYEGKAAHLELRDITFKEYSIVNMPADSHSGIRSVSLSENEITTLDMSHEKAYPAHFFILDMEDKSLVDIAESESNLLEKMDNPETFFKGISGSYLIASAVAEEHDMEDTQTMEKDDTEQDASAEQELEEASDEQVDDTETGDEDILSLTDALSEDLEGKAAASTEASAEDEEPTPEEGEGEEQEASDESAEETKAEEDAGEEQEEEEASEEEELSEDKAEGQETPHSKDVDPETSDGAPKNRESDDEDTSQEESQEQGEEEGESDVDLRVETLEAKSEAYKERVQELEEENAKLRKALHNTLVERVVDAKISLGLVTVESRSEQIEEHSVRAASSLTDTLKDLASLSFSHNDKQSELDELKIDETAEIVDESDNSITIHDDDSTEDDEEDLEEQYVETFTDIFGGRRSLN